MALCSDCTSKTEYTGDSSQTLFTFPFEYVESTDVMVAKYDETTYTYTNLIGGTDWTFENATTIKIQPAPDYTFCIYRCTDIDPLKAEFFPGHPVKAEDLNDNFDQLKKAIEDVRCSINGVEDNLEDNYWDLYKSIKCGDTWESDDLNISTTCAQDARFWNRLDANNAGDTITSSSTNWVYSDAYIATARAIDDRFWNKTGETTYMADTWSSEANDDHTPTTGAVEARVSDLISNIEFEAKLVTGVNQRSGTWVSDDAHIATTDAISERNDTWYSDINLVPDDYIQPGKFWVNTESQRLAYWNDQGYWVHVAAIPSNDAPPVIVSDTEPTGSFIEEGDLWWNKVDGVLYVRYCPDPSGSCQWVDASPSVTGGGDGTVAAIEVVAPLTKEVAADGTITLDFDISTLANV